MADERPLSERLEDLINRGNATRSALRDTVTEAHGAHKDLDGKLKEVRQLIREEARTMARKMLAKELEERAAAIRRSLKEA